MTNYDYYEVVYFDPDKDKFIHLKDFTSHDDALGLAENVRYGYEIYTRVVGHTVTTLEEYEV